MKKNDLLSLLVALAAPLALIAVGIVLFFVPDTGSILLSRILGWILTLSAVFCLVWAVFTHQWGKLTLFVVLLSTGSFLLTRPLALASFMGGFLGVLIALRGVRELTRSATRPGKLLSGALIVVGFLLINVPMRASRLIFSGCGLVLAVCGIAMLVQKLREHRYLHSGRDDIIDAL